MRRVFTDSLLALAQDTDRHGCDGFSRIHCLCSLRTRIGTDATGFHGFVACARSGHGSARMRRVFTDSLLALAQDTDRHGCDGFSRIHCLCSLRTRIGTDATGFHGFIACARSGHGSARMRRVFTDSLLALAQDTDRHGCDGFSRIHCLCSLRTRIGTDATGFHGFIACARLGHGLARMRRVFTDSLLALAQDTDRHGCDGFSRIHCLRSLRTRIGTDATGFHGFIACARLGHGSARMRRVFTDSLLALA
ncbi:MAG: hypothetical protein KatS3mg048_2665 [Caldilinea sp.]|nr:MAG: hypothetical protein KatS3mg048_2665 [Caldilinea sp.]